MWFANNKKLHEDQNYYLDFLKLGRIKKDFKAVKIWRLNRPVDEIRIETIKNHFLVDNVKVIPGQVSGWINELDELEVYDGFHRMCAANDDMYVYIKILTSKRNEDVIKDFKMINMSISVPELYLVETTHIKKKVCEGLAQRMCDAFPNCRSPSRYPQPQNFNRDNFIELMSTLDIDFYIQNVEIKLWNEILGLNKEAKNYVYQHKIKTPKKCEYTNFWLFYMSREFIKNKLEEYFV